MKTYAIRYLKADKSYPWYSPRKEKKWHLWGWRLWCWWKDYDATLVKYRNS